MGCQACRQAESEVNFPLIESDIKNLDPKNLTTPEQKEDFNNFLLTFNSKLPSFGSYLDSDFITLIPKKIQEYTTEHPLSLDPSLIQNIQCYEIKPVEFQNGNIYQGGWNSQMLMEGQGKYFLKEEGVMAEGIWKEGNLFFARVFIPKENDTFDIYEGEIKNSTFNGKGKLISANGIIYEGDFKEGEKTGNGKIIFPDGTIYIGQVEKSDLNGKGKITWKNGYEYEGDFDKNKFGGNGILKGPKGDIYEGGFLNNLFNGEGKYHYYNGNSYEGQFLYGVKKGKGVYKSLNSFEYDGDWDNDLPCGVGKLSTWNNSGIIKSTWRYGKIMEEPAYEKGTIDDFIDIDFNINVDKMMLNIKDLTNIENTETQSTQYKLGTTPSFLDDY